MAKQTKKRPAKKAPAKRKPAAKKRPAGPPKQLVEDRVQVRGSPIEVETVLTMDDLRAGYYRSTWRDTEFDPPRRVNVTIDLTLIRYQLSLIMPRKVICETCDGRGEVRGKRCGTCNNNGYLIAYALGTDDKLDWHIPREKKSRKGGRK